jgi:RimJ/RimL family protein N-acetyltransferase
MYVNHSHYLYTMMNIQYRTLQGEDLGIYRQIRLECLKYYPDYFGTTYEEDLHASSLKFDKVLMAGSGDDFLLGAFADEALIGICGFVRGDRIKTRHHGEIVHMYVNPAFSGKGIGTRLLQLTIEKVFENSLVDQIELAVVDNNERAITTYRRLGFVQYGRLENCFKQGEQRWAQLFMVLTRENYFTF